jgi:hypothetical protein
MSNLDRIVCFDLLIFNEHIVQIPPKLL